MAASSGDDGVQSEIFDLQSAIGFVTRVTLDANGGASDEVRPRTNGDDFVFYCFLRGRGRKTVPGILQRIIFTGASAARGVRRVMGLMGHMGHIGLMSPIPLVRVLASFGQTGHRHGLIWFDLV